ncbi:MAG TPA: glutamate--cysteine ligase [Stellaceae bacterium]|jgi:glutamate--cysteine ligase
MSGPVASGGARITDRRQLVEYLASGSKPAAQWRIGTEHEKFVFRRDDLSRAPYAGPRGIGALLNGMTKFGWRPVTEGDNIIALSNGADASVTLEPGGQFELSGAPLENLHQTCGEVTEHLRQAKEVAGGIGLGILAAGFDPKWRREDIDWMPKGRYAIMRRYMPTRGKLGLDMMLRTCTVQVNLDFADEADMVRKFRLSLALQPVATALFANSPFTEGKLNGYASYRAHIWTDTDPDRTGMLPFVFERGMGFERYVDYMLDVPMYFVYRDGKYIDVAGQSFRDFLAGKLPGLPGELPTMSDWGDHLTTAFPEVRLKKFLEMRGADSGPWGRLCALPALWVGLLYDDAATDAALDLIKDWTREEREALRNDVPKSGLHTRFRGGTVLDLAKATLEISAAGLHRRNRRDGKGRDESLFLDPLREIVASGKSPADMLRDAYQGRWQGSVDPIFKEEAY